MQHIFHFASTEMNCFLCFWGKRRASKAGEWERDKDQLRPANASAMYCKCNKFFHARQHSQKNKNNDTCRFTNFLLGLVSFLKKRFFIISSVACCKLRGSIRNSMFNLVRKQTTKRPNKRIARCRRKKIFLCVFFCLCDELKTFFREINFNGFLCNWAKKQSMKSSFCSLAADVTGNKVMFTLEECTLRVSRAFKKLIFVKTFPHWAELSLVLMMNEPNFCTFSYLLLCSLEVPQVGGEVCSSKIASTRTRNSCHSPPQVSRNNFSTAHTTLKSIFPIAAFKFSYGVYF